MAVPFDERTLTLRGDPITLLENVSTDPASGDADYRISANGTLVYQPRRLTDGRVLTWVDRNGHESPVGTPARAFNSPRVSRDGKHLAFLIQDNSRQDIWTYEIASGKLSPLTQDGDALGLVWTPDSTAIVYGRDGAATSEVLLHRLKGQIPEVLATSVDDNLLPTSTTNDERQVMITAWPPTDDWYLVQAARDSLEPTTILKNPGLPRAAKLSPDNRWLAYTENVRGRTQVFIQGYPEPGLRRQISVEGGRQPVWRQDGKELFFRSGNDMFAVKIDTSAGLGWEKPTLLFTQNHVVTFMDYDVAPDGRFLMIKPAPEENAERQLHVTVNWREQLLSRVPVPR
jgi:protease II